MRPALLYHQELYTHPDGANVANEQTIHTTRRQAHEERIKYEAMEMTALHCDFTGEIYTTVMVFVTKEGGGLVALGDGATVCACLRDEIIAMTPAHPPTDNCVLPEEHLHIVPQAVS